MGYIIAFSLALGGFSAFRCYLTVIKVKSVFVEEWLESDFPWSKGTVQLLWAIAIALRG